MSANDATDIKNAYVSEATDGFLTSTPTKFSKRTIYDFINIVYFKGKWNKDANNFYEKSTPFPFTTIDGKKSYVTSIGFTKKYTYYLENNDAIAYTLNYEKEENERYAGFQMIVILPNKGKSISDIDIRPFLPYDYKDNNDKIITRASSRSDFDEFILKCQNSLCMMNGKYFQVQEKHLYLDLITLVVISLFGL
ncbi:hypothetical protein LY90DRAFT_708942, partial [Neocallimastix californiae]